MNKEELEEIILEPDPARIMEGLRDTGYEFNTAMADIVDNSIAASATVIKIKIEMKPNNTIAVYVADNGIGMDMDGLKNAMKYGSTERIDPSSLGKFGLGLKTASTAFCRSLSVLSRSKTSEYNKVQWDLDEICKINKWKLLQPEILDDEVDILEDVTDGGSGTLVIWEKVDRLMKDYKQDSNRKKAFDRMIDRLKFHFSMVYQRFLDENYTDANQVTMYVNDEKIEPWDPFCKSEENSKMIASAKIDVESPNGDKAPFTIEAWLLPRVENFSSKEAHKQARISNDMEGFYVYRENRLIHQGDWLDMFVKDPHVSLLRVKFSFDHRLDDAFNVDIKKSRILLNDGIYDYLFNKFMPAPRRAAAELYRRGQIQDVKKSAVEAHDASNKNISSKASSIEASKVSVLNPTTGEVSIQNSQGTFTGTLKLQTPKRSGEYNVIPVDEIEDGVLWEPTLVDGNHAVSINQGHAYYSKVYAPNLNNSTLIVGMDSLLWALAEAELSTYNNDTKEQYEEMRIQVSRILRKLVADLPDPDVSGEENSNE
jgi:hypothetical protein